MSKARVLIVGTGSIGERHARCFLRTGRASVGIVEPSDQVREAVASRYHIEATYSDLNQALRGGEWSSAVICTPASMHVALARQCLDASLATLIEKPLAITTQDAARLLARSNDAPPVAVAYVYRCLPALSAMRQALISGRFGRPVQFIAVSGQNFPTYRPMYASTYYAQHQTGGGAIQDALTHIINAAEWLVGPVTRIAVDAAHLLLPKVDVEDTVHAMARHGSLLASYTLNQHQAPNELTLTVICEHGTLRFEGHHDRWRWQCDPRSNWTDCPAGVSSRDTPFELQAHAWLDVMEGKSDPVCSLSEGYQTLAVNEAALTCALGNGTWVDVKVAKEGLSNSQRC